MSKIDRHQLSPEHYQTLIAEEARVWSKGTTELLRTLGGRPDWKTIQKAIYNKVYRGEYWIRAMETASPGLRALEVGCTTGWFALELWRRGADVDAIDISSDLLELGRSTYDDVARHESRPNKIRFIHADANFLDVNTELRDQYDLIFVHGTFHHLPYLERALAGIKARMHEKTLLITIDTDQPYAFQSTINAVATLFIRDVLLHGIRLGRGVLRLLRAIIDPRYASAVVHAHAHDGSPFEGVTEARDIKAALSNNFEAVERTSFGAFVPSLTTPFDQYPAQVGEKAVPLLLFLNRLDKKLIKWGLAKGNLFFGIYKKKNATGASLS
jgi:SAM-dependent methyltransferase